MARAHRRLPRMGILQNALRALQTTKTPAQTPFRVPTRNDVILMSPETGTAAYKRLPRKGPFSVTVRRFTENPEMPKSVAIYGDGQRLGFIAYGRAEGYAALLQKLERRGRILEIEAAFGTVPTDRKNLHLALPTPSELTAAVDAL